MQEDYPSREEERGLVKRFEEQLQQKDFTFFDVTEFGSPQIWKSCQSQ